MLSAGLILLLSAAYMGLLFAVARFGDARADAGRSIISANVYALSLAVYCTSWTFYGSVGRATSGGLSFLTIYIGPTLMLLFGGVIVKMIRISKTQRITSIADFIASRYGKSQLLAGLVTVIAVIGVVPYIALQLKAVAASLDVLLQTSGRDLLPEPMLDSTLVIAALLALFTILFGTRHLDATERHEGMVAAIAFESVVKLVAFLAVGLFVTYGMFGGLSDLFQRAAAAPELARLLQLDSSRAGTWTALILVSALAIVFLPRQFQIIVVENVDESHLRRAVWLFPLYLVLINVFVLPLALGGLLHFPGQGVNPDTFVLTLPLARGGISIGEGAAFALLERAPEIPPAGALLLLGGGESSDAYHMSSPHPEGLGARMAMAAALRSAGLRAEDIDYVNLHGTATPANDAAEGKAVNALFGDRVHCSSTKGATGHTLGAAGAVETVVCALALSNDLLPGGVNTTALDPDIPVAYLLQSRPGQLRRALSYCFGFGGINCSLILGVAA